MSGLPEAEVISPFSEVNTEKNHKQIMAAVNFTQQSQLLNGYSDRKTKKQFSMMKWPTLSDISGNSVTTQNKLKGSEDRKREEGRRRG